MRPITALIITLALLLPVARTQAGTLRELLQECEKLESFRRLSPPTHAGALVPNEADAELGLGPRVLNDMSSRYADIGGTGSVLAAQRAAHDVGKIPGSRVKIVSADHQNKPDIGAGITRQWIDVDHGDAIVDVPTSSVAFAVQEVTL